MMTAQNVEEWNDAASKLASRHATVAPDRPSVLRRILVELDTLMRSGSASVLGAYRLLPEPELVAATKEQLSNLEDDFLVWLPFRQHDDDPALFSLAVQIRTIDEMLASRIGANAHLVHDDDLKTPAGTHFVVPAAASRDYRRGERGLGSTYERRGILKHRVVAATINGVAVRLLSAGSLRAGHPPKPLRLGAALTTDLELDAPSTGMTFTVRTAGSVNWPYLLHRQAYKAITDGVDLAVWPELSVSKDAVSIIAKALSAPRPGDRRSKLQLVVAGSHHRPLDDGRVHNTATVLSGKGRVLDFHDKVVPFESKTLGVENLKPGSSVLVIICDGFIASAAICKDFCDAGIHLPWERLDVDLVLVPSMGDHSTMLAHLDKARSLRIDRNIRTFVVQQFYPRGSDDPLGLVLAAPRNPPRDDKDLHENGEWKSYDID